MKFLLKENINPPYINHAIHCCAKMRSFCGDAEFTSHFPDIVSSVEEGKLATNGTVLEIIDTLDPRNAPDYDDAVGEEECVRRATEQLSDGTGVARHVG